MDSRTEKLGSFAEEMYNLSGYIASAGQIRPNVELPVGTEICVLQGDRLDQRIEDLAVLEGDIADLQIFNEQDPRDTTVNWFDFEESIEITGWLDNQPDITALTQLEREGIEDSERARKAKAPVGTESAVYTRTESAANTWTEGTVITRTVVTNQEVDLSSASSYFCQPRHSQAWGRDPTFVKLLDVDSQDKVMVRTRMEESDEATSARLDRMERMIMDMAETLRQQQQQPPPPPVPPPAVQDVHVED
ncbi:DASH complex subunit DAM1-like [Camellia sinensis]|uniref:DASH complex subunit DAM1-like n=1 Tax=Camellia sinensis TaxID=4442 RepID=UPI0010369C3C|nr:DASH complex subunit DAM1-like [Camellia sinensis]